MPSRACALEPVSQSLEDDQGRCGLRPAFAAFLRDHDMPARIGDVGRVRIARS